MFFFLLSATVPIRVSQLCLFYIFLLFISLTDTLSTFKSQMVHAMMVTLSEYRFNVVLLVVCPAGVTKITLAIWKIKCTFTLLLPKIGR